MTREIDQEVVIDSSPEQVFEALITPSIIKKWWFAASAIVIPEEEGVYAVTWGTDEDDPDYITVSTIKEINKPHRLVLRYDNYLSKQGKLPFEADMMVAFGIETVAAGVRLTAKQTGFPLDAIANDYYQGCIQGWIDTLSSIKRIVEE